MFLHRIRKRVGYQVFCFGNGKMDITFSALDSRLILHWVTPCGSFIARSRVEYHFCVAVITLDVICSTLDNIFSALDVVYCIYKVIHFVSIGWHVSCVR